METKSILKLNNKQYKEYEKLILNYFVNDLNDSHIDFFKDKLIPFIKYEAEKNLSQVWVLIDENEIIGFCRFQIDSEECDWCKFVGKGCIMEFCIENSHRKRGLGKAFASEIEKQLHLMGASEIYLQSHNAIPFWEKCGYIKQDVCISERNSNLRLLTKTL